LNVTASVVFFNWLHGCGGKKQKGPCVAGLWEGNVKKIYIASAYTVGDTAINVKRQIDVADQLISLGFAPFAPLMSHFQHMVHPRPYMVWIHLDQEWVLACDAVLRLPGVSAGADSEVALARQHGIPVVHSIEELMANNNL
jgi:hypothetical protein